MARKRWTRQLDESPALAVNREKRKWQITLRRYIIQQNDCPAYAPYFGLPISDFRKWIAIQFPEGIGWEDFGKSWQFDHIVPLSCFDIHKEEDLRLCWHFTNIRMVPASKKEKETGLALNFARKYYEILEKETGLDICKGMLGKIKSLQEVEMIAPEKQIAFLQERKDLLKDLSGFNQYEFELLNEGKTPEEVKKENEFLKNLGKQPD